MNRRRFLPLALILLQVSCAHVPPPSPLSNDAARFFARADSDDNAGSAILDLDALRALGFLKPAPQGQHSVWSDLVAYTLPTVAGEFRNQPEGPILARTAVLFALFREWDDWPRVQKVGVILPASDDPEASAERLVAMIAVEGPPSTGDMLLRAIAAADRAAGTPDLEPLDGNLCLPPDRQKERWCVRAGDGYLAVGSPTGLAGLPALLQETHTRPVAPAILRVRLNLPTLGKGYLVIEPRDGVQLRAAFASHESDVAALVKQKADEIVAQLEARHDAQQALMAPILEQAQRGLAHDAQAPASLKAAARRLTIDGLLDPEGTWAAIRKSITVARNGNLVTAEAVVPAASVRHAAEGSTSFLSFAAVGLLSSIAIPTILKYQCENKEAEATAALASAASNAREVYESGKPVTNLASFNFTPPGASLYTYCLGQECVPCQAQGCFVPAPDKNPCLRLAKSDVAEKKKYRFLMCAIADLDGQSAEGDLDVWVVTDDGVPKHLQDDCK
jgi:hypothetical protein